MINTGKIIREPLIHFLLIGAALFFFYYLQNGMDVRLNNKIIIDEANIDRLITIWNKKRLRPPTQLELKGLIEQQIREEILYREALALGLDQNDGIVRRRLAQKVEFIFSDIAAQSQPKEAELEKYLKKHNEQFLVPGKISFKQVYFNIEKHGSELEKDIQQVLSRLTQDSSKIDINNAGDAFMLGHHHQQLTKNGVARIFGNNFAKKLFSISIGNWQGPIQSGYGLHLIKIESKTNNKIPELNTVRDKVLREWHVKQNKIMNEQFYQKLRQRYEIVINSGLNQP